MDSILVKLEELWRNSHPENYYTKRVLFTELTRQNLVYECIRCRHVSQRNLRGNNGAARGYGTFASAQLNHRKIQFDDQ